MSSVISTKGIDYTKFIDPLVDSVAMQICQVLSDKYGFDANDAYASLHMKPAKLNEPSVILDTIQTQNTSRLIPNIPLPFCGIVNENWCQGIRLNHGLHTQCTQLPLGGSALCKTCQNQCAKSQQKYKQPTYGLISDRMQHITNGGKYNEWRDPRGMLVTPYVKVMTKMKLQRDVILKEVARLGWTISEEHFESVQRAAGRPKKSTVVSDTESESGESVDYVATKAKRGRPRKQKLVVSKNTGDDLIAELLINAKSEIHSQDDINILSCEPNIHIEQAEASEDLHIYRSRLIEFLQLVDPARVNDADSILAQYRTSESMFDELQERYGRVFAMAQNESLKSVNRTDLKLFTHDGCEFLRGTDNILYDVESMEEVGVYSIDGRVLRMGVDFE